MNPNNIVRGDDLMVFDPNGHSIAFATSHTLTLSGETTDISSKDHGQWSATTVSKVSWEASTENLYTDSEFDTLYGYMIARQPIDIYFGHHKDIGASYNPVDNYSSYAYWTKATTAPLPYTGKAVITSLSVNANNGENATFSATFTGCSGLNKVTA